MKQFECKACGYTGRSLADDTSGRILVTDCPLCNPEKYDAAEARMKRDQEKIEDFLNNGY